MVRAAEAVAVPVAAALGMELVLDLLAVAAVAAVAAVVQVVVEVLAVEAVLMAMAVVASVAPMAAAALVKALVAEVAVGTRKNIATAKVSIAATTVTRFPLHYRKDSSQAT